MLATATPVSSSAAPSRTNPPGTETPAEKRRRTLLIVDDEEGPRQSLRVVFKAEYDLLLASDGPAAIEMARQNKIDAAILDIRMHGMNGIDVLQGLKAVDKHIEVIMLTAYEHIDDVRKALRLGACDYLTKPFDIPAIRTAVANAMERRSLSVEVNANSDKLRHLQDELQNQKVEEEMHKTRGEIYASIIHDINGPLTIMSGFLQLINQRIGEATKVEGEELEQLKDRLRRITKQVTNCIDISRRYLNLFRAHPGETMRVSVNQTLSDIHDLMRVHPAVKNNELVFTPAPEDVVVQVHGTDLMQIVRNLTVNALQCIEAAHRVEVRAGIVNESIKPGADTTEERWIITEGFQNTAPLLAISICDNGRGIAAEHMPKLFAQQFTTHQAGNGTGLGLSIVRRLVSNARGAIHVRTKVGSGTTFTIYLSIW
jgi:two-component system, sensor histidine kinase and response regulator